ncbi:MAG: bacillithiol biosynthesis BshC, partial [Bacteroidota bacterium]
VLAEEQKQLNALSNLESKLLRAEKNRHNVAINQIRNLKEKLFPGNGLQERHDNFLPFYLKHGQTYFDTLKQHLHPLDKVFTVFVED